MIKLATTVNRFALATVLLIGFLAIGPAVFAQTATVSATPADIQLAGGLVGFLPDGGCVGQPVFSDPTNRAATWRPFSSGLCATAKDRFMRAATLDVGVNDGGQP